jgi:hypothetical protein
MMQKTKLNDQRMVLPHQETSVLQLGHERRLMSQLLQDEGNLKVGSLLPHFGQREKLGQIV